MTQLSSARGQDDPPNLNQAVLHDLTSTQNQSACGPSLNLGAQALNLPVGVGFSRRHPLTTKTDHLPGVVFHKVLVIARSHVVVAEQPGVRVRG